MSIDNAVQFREPRIIPKTVSRLLVAATIYGTIFLTTYLQADSRISRADDKKTEASSIVVNYNNYNILEKTVWLGEYVRASKQ